MGWGRKEWTRIFNTSRACVPEKHYTVLREVLIAPGEQGRFFTIFAPRQTGKTTYFQLLFRHLRQTGYTPVRVSCESLQTIGRTKFYHTLGRRLAMGLLEKGLTIPFKLQDQVDLQTSLEKTRWVERKLVLVIDEFEETPQGVERTAPRLSQHLPI